jgi:uridine phosphorylase
MSKRQFASIPILNNKNYSEVSVFQPENLLREARRQKDLEYDEIPDICILDPDGDFVDYLKCEDRVVKSKHWACYHSDLYLFQIDGTSIGVIPRAVGASYAVLVAEQLFVSGCKMIISITSAGIINQPLINKQFALITEAIRDEGTSYHYLPENEPSLVPYDLFARLENDSEKMDLPWFGAKSWTTDAPYRETETAISAMKEDNITCVEMEAAALYAFAKAKNKKIICFAHLTNTMAQQEGDFEKGENFGSIEMLNLIEEVIKKLEA